MTLTVVHVVGEADTGITRASQGSDIPGRNLRVAAWCAGLATARGDDPAAARRILCDGWIDSELGVEFEHTPLATLLGFLGTRDPAPGISLVLVTTAPATAGVPTAVIGHALSATLREIPDVFGTPVHSVVVLDVEGFTDDHVVEPLVDTLHKLPPGDVVMSWGAGSTGLALAAVAGLVESGRPWELRSTTSPDQVVDLVPPARTNSLVSWLFRLGYPGEIVRLAEERELGAVGDEVVKYARTLQSRLDRTAANGGDLADLTEWVRSDLRRLDGTAGLAVRAWLAHRYRDLLGTDQAANIVELHNLLEVATKLLGDKETPTLGTLLNRLREHARQVDLPPATRASFESRSGTWLMSTNVKRVNGAANASAHQFVQLPPNVLKILRSWLRPKDDHPPVPVFDMPNRAVAMLWAAGHNETPLSATVLHRATDATILRHVGITNQQKIRLSCLVMGTAGDRGTVDAARAEADTLRAGGADSLYFSRIEATVLEVAGLDSLAAEQTFARALESQTTAPDVLVVVPVGSKVLAVGALLAALRFAESHAIPVLLECTDRTPGALPSYHRVVPALGADHILVDLAQRALGRLELHTAGRLLAIGSPEIRGVGEQVDDLISGLRMSPARKVAWLSICARRLDARNLSGPDQVRLVHIAAENMEKWRTLRTVRNELLINHGSATNQTIMQVIRRETENSPRRHTPSSLVCDALRHVQHDAAETARLTELYSAVRASLEDRRRRFAETDRVGRAVRPASLDNPQPET